MNAINQMTVKALIEHPQTRLLRSFNQLRDLTSQIDKGDPAFTKRNIRNRADDQAPTCRGYASDGSVKVNDFERKVNEPGRIFFQEALQG